MGKIIFFILITAGLFAQAQTESVKGFKLQPTKNAPPHPCKTPKSSPPKCGLRNPHEYSTIQFCLELCEQTEEDSSYSVRELRYNGPEGDNVLKATDADTGASIQTTGKKIKAKLPF